MSISEYLDVFIGLAFTYLILSLIVTVIFESIAQFTRLRARNLQRAIRKLLEVKVKAAAEVKDKQDKKAQKEAKEKISNSFYEHALVKSLKREKEEKSNGTNWIVSLWRFFRGKPHFSYIESSTFALVALDTLFPRDDTGNKNIQDLTELVKKLPDCKLKEVTLTHLRSGVDDLKELREGIESWFNNTMDRLSGWFTRTARWMSLIIGLIVAIVLNVDTLVVADAFWKEPVLRANVASYAADTYEKYLPDSTFTKDDVGRLREELESLELPIGWDAYGPDSTVVSEDMNWLQASWAVTKLHIIGWLITALAVSLGAHFWFDLLRRIVKLRAAGVSPAEKKKPKS